MRLHHVNVVVADGETASVVPFYELLGLTRVTKPTEGVAQVGAWFDFPDGRTQVHVSERPVARHAEQHFAVSVDDLEAVAAGLVAAGHPWKPGTVVLGARRGMTRDPSGNAVEVLEAVGPWA